MSASPPPRYTGSRSPSPRQDENRPRSMSIERPQRREARSPTRPAHSKDTRYSLYVSGLSPKVTEDDLYDHFNKEGKVTESRIVSDPRTYESRGFGFVGYATEQEQDDAIRYLDDSNLQGRAIRVEKVPQPPPLQSLEIDPNHDFSSSHILPSSKATTPCFPDCITFPSQSPHPCSSATPNPEGQYPMSAACYGFTFTSHIPQPARIWSHIPRR
ncbi:TPA: hypothetical protein ACH3X3_001948 [Trebouxia sp. C0006]